MSVDPLPGSADDPQSVNRYPYVVNDPVNLVDPLGLQGEETPPHSNVGCWLAIRSCFRYVDHWGELKEYCAPIPILSLPASFCQRPFSKWGWEVINLARLERLDDLPQPQPEETRAKIDKYTECLDKAIRKFRFRALAFGAVDALHGQTFAGIALGSIAAFEIGLALSTAPTPLGILTLPERIALVTVAAPKVAMVPRMVKEGQTRAVAEAESSLNRDSAECVKLLQ